MVQTEMTYQEVDQHLARVAEVQSIMKPDELTRITKLIALHMLKHTSAWPDEVDLPDVAMEDRNCIGSAWRRLMNHGIIERTTDFRRTKKRSSKGRSIFRYVLTSSVRAQHYIETGRFNLC